MKVALDVSAVPVRVAGAGRYVVEVARRMPTMGIETTLVTRRHDADRWAEWSPDASLASIVPDGRAARLAYEAWALGVSVPARAADVWHGPHYTMPRRGATPTVVTIHDLTFFSNPEWHERSKVLFFRRAIRHSVEHADVLISVSEFTARLISTFFASHVPVVVAPLGVDLARFSPLDVDDEARWAKHRMPMGVRYVFFLGTAEPRKGLDVLLDAFAELSRDDLTVELWLAGQSGWGLPGFEGELARHPAASRIRRLGYVDEQLLPVLLRRASVVAYPSRGEGFGLPVLEALACGAPVVTTSDTVMAEVAGTAAALVPVGDAGALAAALVAALTQGEDTRRRAAEAARARAELFTWESAMAAHRRAYDLAKESR